MPAMMAANIILFMILLTLDHSVLRNRSMGPLVRDSDRG